MSSAFRNPARAEERDVVLDVSELGGAMRNVADPMGDGDGGRFDEVAPARRHGREDELVGRRIDPRVAQVLAVGVGELHRVGERVGELPPERSGLDGFLDADEQDSGDVDVGCRRGGRNRRRACRQEDGNGRKASQWSHAGLGHAAHTTTRR